MNWDQIEGKWKQLAGSAARSKLAGKGTTMLRIVARIMKCASIPVLLIASIFTSLAGSYQLPVNLAIWLGAFYLAQRAIRRGEYFFAAGFGAVVIVFSPLLLVDKIFLFMGYTGIATYLSVAAAFRPQPMEASL